MQFMRNGKQSLHDSANSNRDTQFIDKQTDYSESIAAYNIPHSVTKGSIV